MEAEVASKKWIFTDRDSKWRMQRYFRGKRRHCPFKGQDDVHHTSYKRFRRRIFQRSGCESPAASTPLTTRGQCEPSFEFDTVCQRLELDSPQRHEEPGHTVIHGNSQERLTGSATCFTAVSPEIMTACTLTAPQGCPSAGNASQQGWVWRAATQENENSLQADSDGRRHDVQPFATLGKSFRGPQDGPVMKMAAPSLVNDYYTNLLDCSCNGMIALALGSSVYLWNSESQALVGCLENHPKPGPPYHQTDSVSCLCWSRDGRALSIGTRRGEIQLWDVEQNQRVSCLSSHLSVVGALSWNQKLLSSGSVLGCIHHFDPRASTTLVGAAVQQDGICSLQWSPEDDMLASGSTEGLLCIWDRDIAGFTRARQPITRMKQPSAVKAMGWCPWQSKTIATGGGWKDGELRIWDADSATCVSSENTNSQICSLHWAEKRRYLVTGHGLPRHQVTCWSWDFPHLSPTLQLTGHSQRVLHVAVNPDNTQIFTAGADQHLQIWDI
ncbi:cell division cycle protein 20 homolog B-like%2C partial [Xyrichtys novacula]|uniref:Cell division cycle protein 20 homolog B-like, partial n=1 Tax=Xyrichtys novacula TaxID=13765 RepID=A0AAV1G7C4_XYRNO|nr:cell division cycle protein 20 homolog B-like%2C partial [Xyrichtys novacula]